MSFIREKEQVLRKYPQYRVVSEIKNQNEMKETFYGLIRDHFDEKAWVEVPKTSLRQIAANMAICLGEEADAYNLMQNLDDKFYILDGTDESSSRISRKFGRNALRPYIEHRYWDLKMNLEFCIAAGIPYEKIAFFSTNMMGIPWNYIRNVEYITADFCLRYNLSH